MAILKKPGGSTPEALELARILQLPVIPFPSEEDVEVFCFDRMLAPAFEEGQRLFPIQVAAVQGYEMAGGGIFPIGVGWGKTGISLMIAQRAYNAGIRKILLLVPVNLVSGLMKRHLPEWSKRVPLSVPFHFLGGRSSAARLQIARSNAAGVYVFPYSLLSVSDTMDLLPAIDADLVIADEVHNLKNHRAARVNRFLDFMRSRSKVRPVQFVGMSGTITAKKIAEYHHLMDFALGDGSPMPRSSGMTYFWGQILNADADTPEGRGRKILEPLLSWAGETFGQKFDPEQTESYRRAYRLRMTSAPGVVASGDEDIGVSLCIENRPPKKLPGEALKKLIKDVDEGMTPQGEPIDHAIHGYKWLYELSAGFYNGLLWPSVERIMRARNVGPVEAELLIERAKMHHVAKQNYHKGLREFFKNAPAGLDTPREVSNSIRRYGPKFVGSKLAALHQEMVDLEFDGMPKRFQQPVRIDSFKVDHAVEWAKEFGCGVIWVYNEELGAWIVEAISNAGLEVYHCPAGADELIESIGDPGRGGKGDKLCVASIGSHGTGRNLQAFQNQLFAQWPRAALQAEQTLGRLHRNGQQADALVAHTNFVMEFDHANRAATLNDAIYIQQTTGSRQKVIYADYDPLPLIYSDEFLREGGFQPERLSPDQKKLLREKFGAEVS